MEKRQNSDEIPSVYLSAISGAEEILKKIENSPLKERLLLKNDDFLEKDKYHKMLIEKIEFFTQEDEIKDTIQELELMFQSQIKSRKADEKGEYLRFCIEVEIKSHKILFELRLILYTNKKFYPVKKNGTGVLDKEKFTYFKFPPEEYLAVGFYEIISSLELLNDLSWYKEIYELLNTQLVEGRKIWEGFHSMILRHPISSLEQRMSTLKGYETYSYMRRRWEMQSRKRKESYPKWEQVITLLVTFFTPILEGILKDEVFLGDWIPQLGRYLD